MDKNENYFTVSNPDERICQVFRWTNFHSSLFIKLWHPKTKDTEWLRFVNPLYVEIRNSWQGASFTLASGTELLNHWQKLWGEEYNREQFLNNMLFRVKPINLDCEFKIICVDARILTGTELEMLNIS